jgi:FKBP-type peptidyl-prolyl cis-trans isomerase
MGGARLDHGVLGERRLARLLGVGLLSVTVLAGCSTLLGSAPKQQVIENTTFDPSLGIDLGQMQKTPAGVYYQDVVVGSGQKIQANDTISIGYQGWLSDGTQFAQSDSIAFPLGMGAVIPGLEDGVSGEGADPMRVGGERKLVIPPGMGYGVAGYGSVPGGRILIFDIVLKGIGGVTP